MLLIKLFVKCVALLGLTVFVLTACSNPFNAHTYTEVDFSQERKVQLTYKQNIYDINVQYTRSVLSLNFADNNTAFDGISYKVTPESCQVYFSELAHSFDIKAVPENYLPVLLWDFFAENGSNLIADNYDSQRMCYYSAFTINNSFVKFEVYENEGNVSYTLIIT